jgi:hypothetical protein
MVASLAGFVFALFLDYEVYFPLLDLVLKHLLGEFTGLVDFAQFLEFFVLQVLNASVQLHHLDVLYSLRLVDLAQT